MKTFEKRKMKHRRHRCVMCLFLRLLPGEGLQLPVEVEDGELDGLPARVQTDRELWLAPVHHQDQSHT